MEELKHKVGLRLVEKIILEIALYFKMLSVASLGLVLIYNFVE